MMQRTVTIGITFLLIVGFSMPSCEPKDSCHGVTFYNYYEVDDIEVKGYTDLASNDLIAEADTILFEELDVIQIDYLVTYMVSQQPKRDWSFSLMPSALACSYIPGYNGSKTQQLTAFSIVTLNDFDDEYMANSNINELFEYTGSFWDNQEAPISLNQFLAEQTKNLEGEDMILKLTKAPELNKELRLKVKMELSTGDIFEFETAPFVIKS